MFQYSLTADVGPGLHEMRETTDKQKWSAGIILYTVYQIKGNTILVARYGIVIWYHGSNVT